MPHTYLSHLNSLTIYTSISAIYQTQFQMKQENTRQDSAFYLELQCTIQDEQFHTSLYDKCDSCSFNVVNYPFVEQSNIRETPSYGIHINAWSASLDSYKDFKIRHYNLCLKLYHHAFKYHKMCKHLKTILPNHNVLYAKYNV